MYLEQRIETLEAQIADLTRRLEVLEATAAGDWLSTTETAALLDLSYGTIKNMITDGRLPGAVQIGRNWRIPRETVLAILEARP